MDTQTLGTMNIPIRDVVKKHATINVKVTGVKTWRCCLWFSVKLIKLAALISGFHCKITEAD